MKTLSQVSSNTAKYKTIKAESNSINYIDANNLKTYLDVADKFLSSDSKDVINYLIVNNESYLSELSTDNDENAIDKYFPITIKTRLNSFVRKTLSMTGLYSSIKSIAKKILRK